MTLLPSDLAELLGRFPNEFDLINGLIEKDETFHALCEEYAIAQRALRHLREAQAASDEAVLADYRNLVLELECEIEESLDVARGC